jgi:hypothetical protein
MFKIDAAALDVSFVLREHKTVLLAVYSTIYFYASTRKVSLDVKSAAVHSLGNESSYF